MKLFERFDKCPQCGKPDSEGFFSDEACAECSAGKCVCGKEIEVDNDLCDDCAYPSFTTYRSYRPADEYGAYINSDSYIAYLNNN